MKVYYSSEFKASLSRFPENIKKKFYKQVEYLLRDFRHPSLRAKKYDESRNIWQARADKNIRFYFLIENGTYILLDIKSHPK